MAAMDTIGKEISEDLDGFFATLETKYLSKLDQNAIVEKIALSDCFRELKLSTERLVNLHLTEKCPRRILQYKVTGLHQLACSEIRFWKLAIERRKHLKPKHSNPWKIEFISRLHKDVFLYIKNMLTCVSMFGIRFPRDEVDSKRVTKRIFVEITDYRKLRQFFAGVCESCVGKTGFETRVKSKGHVDLIVTKEKAFVLVYNVKTETVTVTCSYGSWNEEGVAQYI